MAGAADAEGTRAAFRITGRGHGRMRSKENQAGQENSKGGCAPGGSQTGFGGECFKDAALGNGATLALLAEMPKLLRQPL